MTTNSNQTTKGDVALDLVRRLLRETGLADRKGVTGVLNQLEIAPIPIGAVVPIACSIMRAAINDQERIKQGIPLVYIWLEAYFLGQKGAKKFAFMLKDLAQEQLAGKAEEIEAGQEAE
jgi:hypothetical protein